MRASWALWRSICLKVTSGVQLGLIFWNPVTYNMVMNRLDTYSAHISCLSLFNVQLLCTHRTCKKFNTIDILISSLTIELTLRNMLQCLFYLIHSPLCLSILGKLALKIHPQHFLYFGLPLAVQNLHIRKYSFIPKWCGLLLRLFLTQGGGINHWQSWSCVILTSLPTLPAHKLSTTWRQNPSMKYPLCLMISKLSVCVVCMHVCMRAFVYLCGSVYHEPQ